MGCCVSTNSGSSREKKAHLQVGLESFHQKPIFESRAPPPSAEELETVKEVLSETPKPKALPKDNIFVPQEEENEKTQIEKPAFVKIQEKESLNFNIKTEPKSPVNVIEESALEDASEICSVSLSESVSTITDRRDEEEEVRQQKVFRSPARSGSRNQVVGRSPTRKLDQSPGRRNGVVNGGSSLRLVQSREPTVTVRRASRPDPPRKDPGESSGRRSRSPAVNRSVMGRSPSGRTNQSPGKARRDPGGESGYSNKLEQQQHGTTTTTMEGKWPSSNNNGATTSAPNESLENPLVSLECFIFL